MLPFLAVNGLAGDVVVIGGIISQREAEISSLQEQSVELEDTRGVEAGAIEKDIKGRIKDLEKQLKATERERLKRLQDSQIAYSKRRKPIMERIEELQQLNDHDRSLIAPIRKLPAELLGHVFQHHVDLDNSPWVLILVSRSWRHTAMTTPSLWVHLSIFSTEHRRCHRLDGLKEWEIAGKSWYSIGRRVVCHSSSELNTIVHRAGSLPLDVHIVYRNDNVSVVQSVLGDTAIARRVASLEINTAGPARMGVTVGAFPLLHTLAILSLPEEVKKEIFESISSSSPGLKHLTTHQTIPVSPDLPFWSSLRSLNINRHLSNKSLNSLIPHLGELETLEGCPEHWPDAHTPEVSLTKLTTLSVFCVPGDLCKLQLPALLRLSIEVVAWDPLLEKNRVSSISLPTLEVLEVTTLGSPSWLALLSAPSMRVLVISEECRIYGGELSTFPTCHFPAVRDFSLHYPYPDRGVIAALECVPNVEKVVISRFPSSDQWGLEILQRLADAENMLCPNMTQLTLGSSPRDRLVVNKGSVNARARKAIKNRADRGVRMDHFEIHFENRRESIQYV